MNFIKSLPLWEIAVIVLVILAAFFRFGMRGYDYFAYALFFIAVLSGILNFADSTAFGAGICPIDAMPDNLRAIEAAPDKIIFRNAAVRAHEHIGIIMPFFENLHQAASVTEGVEVHAGFDSHAEFFPKIFIAHFHLTDKGFPRRHQAIRLNIPAAHNLPFACLHQFFDSLEKFRLIGFHPLIKKGLIVIEYKIVKLLAEVCGNTEGGNSFCHPFFLLPKPNGV